MLEFLSKTASILDKVESPAAKQAAAAIEGVLKAHAARRTTVMTPEEVAEFNNKLKDFLDATLGSGKIPRGLKWRLLQLKDGHAHLSRQLAKLEKQQAMGERPMIPAEPPGDTTPVEMPAPVEMAPSPQGASSGSDVHARPWADIAEEALREKAERTPAPVALPELARKPAEVTEDMSAMMQGDLAGDMVAGRPAVQESPAPAPARKYEPQGTRAEEPQKPVPQGTHAETWDEKLKRWMGLGSRAELLSDMIKVADRLDAEGQSEAAEILERIVVAAADQYPSLNETRKDLYDFDAHNAETMHEKVKQEVEENRKNHHLQTHQGMAVSQTRYSPDMPGVMMRRISDGVYQDMVTNKVYDFQHGFVDAQGNQRAGGSIKHQTPTFSQYAPPSRIFEGAGVLSKRK